MSLSLRGVDRRNPINWRHPLNSDTVAWFLALPGWSGGPVFKDLVRVNDGVIQSPASSGCGWRSSTRPASFGELLLENPAFFVKPPGQYFQYANNYTVAAWAYCDAPNGNFQAIWGGRGAINRFMCLLPSGNFIVRGGGTNVQDSTNHCGAWHRFGMSVSSVTGLTGYMDGVAVCSDPTATGGNSLELDSSIGTLPEGSDFPFAGRLDDLKFIGRAWSAAEFTLDFQLSLRGYPGVLNRSRFPLLGVASTGFSPWFARSSRVLGSGVY